MGREKRYIIKRVLKNVKMVHP